MQDNSAKTMIPSPMPSEVSQILMNSNNKTHSSIKDKILINNHNITSFPIKNLDNPSEVEEVDLT